MSNMFRWYAIGAGVLVAFALVIGMTLVFRKPKGGDFAAYDKVNA